MKFLNTKPLKNGSFKTARNMLFFYLEKFNNERDDVKRVLGRSGVKTGFQKKLSFTLVISQNIIWKNTRH